MIKEKLMAENLLKEELDEILIVPENSYKSIRASNLKDALEEIKQIKSLINSYESLLQIKNDAINANEQYVAFLEEKNKDLLDTLQRNINESRREASVKGLFIALIVKIFSKSK